MNDATTVLDDAAAFLGQYLAATDAQIDAMTLYAAATHAIRYSVTFPRMLFVSQTEASGKTEAMMRTALLSAAPEDASGTVAGWQNKLKAATNSPEQPVPTMYLDEVSSVFGRSGLGGGNNKLAEVLRKGYKRGATQTFGNMNNADSYSVFTPFLMAGLKTAVPRDIRTRSIVITMKPGTPRKYFDVRTGEARGRVMAAAIAGAVTSHKAEVSAFRASRVKHPKLTGRAREVWEPLLAVAYAIGGQRWLNRAMAAFEALTLAEAGVETLTPAQQTAKDAAAIAEQYGEDFIPAAVVYDELRRTGNPLYSLFESNIALGRQVREDTGCLVGVKKVDGQPVRCFRAMDLIEAWTALAPAESEDVEFIEEEEEDDGISWD